MLTEKIADGKDGTHRECHSSQRSDRDETICNDGEEESEEVLEGKTFLVLVVGVMMV